MPSEGTRDWPTHPIYINHLEAMGLAMALMAEQERDGLSEPQVSAQEKVNEAVGVLLAQLNLSSDAT